MYIFLFINIIVLSFIFNISLCYEDKEVKYIITEINSKYPYKDEQKYFYDNYNNNYLYATIKLGSNEQIMEMKIDLNLYETYIARKDLVNTKLYTPYETELSTTFNTSKRFFSQKGEFSKALLAKDNLIVNDGQKDIKLNDFYFAYIDDDYGNKPAGSIGFNLLKTVIYPEESMNFIDQLKSNDIISGYSLTIKFTSNYNGHLLIGADLEDIIPKEIEKYNKHIIKASGNGILNDGKWEIDLNRVLVGDSELLKSKKITFDLKEDFILATDEYSEFIFKNFFSSLFGTEKCIREELPSFKYYLGIKCQKNINVTNFPDLIFDMFSNYEKFQLVLDYEDLFVEIGEYKYFKIIITSNEISTISINNNWIFGKDFFKMNLVTFNKDRKDISIYTPIKEKKNNEENNEEKNEKKNEDNNSQVSKIENDDKINLWLWILIVILIIMIGIITYLLIKCIEQNKIIKKRKRFNILEDELNDNDIN